MVDLEKLSSFIRRVHERRLREKATEEGARPIYVRVKGGPRRGAAPVVWSSSGDDLGEREPSDVVSEIADALAGDDRDIPKAWCEAVYAGGTKAIDSQLVMAREPIEKATTRQHDPNAGAAVALNRALTVIENMAREAMIRADAADARAAGMIQAQLDQAVRIRELEMERGTVAPPDAMTIAAAEMLPMFSTVAQLAIARKYGLAAPASPALEDQQPKAASTPEQPTQDSEEAETYDPRTTADDAISMLIGAVETHPELLQDEALTGRLQPLVMKALGLAT